MFRLAIEFIKLLQPIIVPICFGCAWLLMALSLWTIWTSGKTIFARAKIMHQIPCSNCVFFTNNHRLKCTVHPIIASTEGAIDCRDYQGKIKTTSH